MPQLEGLFGAGAFDERNADARFSVFLQSGAPLAAELSSAWASLRAEQPGVLDGPLATPAAALGLNVARGELYPSFQNALTVAREEHAYREVDTRFRALPARTQSRLAWLSKDAFSRALVVSSPPPAYRDARGRCDFLGVLVAEGEQLAALAFPSGGSLRQVTHYCAEKRQRLHYRALTVD
jgi:hypothetical protein